MKRVITFASSAVAGDTFIVASFAGREAMSTLFRYDIELISQREDLDFDAMLEEPAWLGIQQGLTVDGGVDGVKTLKIHGILAQFEQLDQGEGWTRYRAALVPALWRSTLNARSRVFIGLSVPEIADAVLADAGLAGEDHEQRLGSRSYAPREYVVQYNESDHQFLSRLLEHEGIFHFFRHGETRSTLVLGDGSDSCERLDGSVDFHQAQEHDVAASARAVNQPEAVHGLVCRQTAVPAEIVLQDFNYRAPAHALKATRTVADKGAFGTVYSYGEHYKDGDEGEVYARLRAEEIACTRRTFSGRGDVRSFRSGAIFSLSGHYRDDFNAGYLITQVDHHASQVVDHGSGVIQTSTYDNHFTCIRDDLPFRPQRVTPRPRVAGALNALVDAGGGGEYAELDDQGRYKVRLPLDLSGRGDGAASRYVRMAQPYAGDGMGMHFPLHKGTEVLLTHVNGDPDRPIIAGAVTNPETANVVTGRNQTQSVIRSGGRNEMRFEDADGAEELVLHASRDGVVAVAHDQRITVGHDQSIAIERDRSLTVTGKHTVATTGAHRESRGASSELTIAKDASAAIGGSRTQTVGKDETVTIGGASSEAVGGSRSVRVGKDIEETAGGHRTEATAGKRTLTAKHIAAEAADEIVLRTGKAGITLRADGTVLISGTDIRIAGTGKIAVKAAKNVAIMGAKVTGN
ncbi:MAG: type VI secretion system tip protein VgrG [Planctomycetes bacterium]|nr:type VI secretion system tip protein VgrG [Planctomycetota bacterium]